MVTLLLQNCVEESRKRLLALSIHHWHVDVEQPQEGVRSVFDPPRIATRGPRKLACDTDVCKWTAKGENLSIDIGNLLKQFGKVLLFSEHRPVRGDEGCSEGSVG